MLLFRSISRSCISALEDSLIILTTGRFVWRSKRMLMAVLDSVLDPWRTSLFLYRCRQLLHHKHPLPHPRTTPLKPVSRRAMVVMIKSLHQWPFRRQWPRTKVPGTKSPQSLNVSQGGLMFFSFLANAIAVQYASSPIEWTFSFRNDYH